MGENWLMNERIPSHDLYKLPNGRFIIVSPKLKNSHTLPTPEGAAEAMAIVGVSDDEFDAALIDMALRGNNHASFSTTNGMFIASDKVNV